MSTMTDQPKQDQPVLRRNRPEAIGAEFAAEAFRRAGFTNPTLVLRWTEIVGPDISRMTRPLKLTESPQGGVLTLMAEPAASVFLQHETRTLCDRINAFLGRPAVSRLRFVKGAITSSPRNASARHRSTPKQGDPALSFVGPDRLKAALVALARARRRPD